MLSSTHSILRMAIKCCSLRPNASRFGSDCFQWPWRLADLRLIGSALFDVLPAGPMHRAFQRLDQFVSFNLIAAPVVATLDSGIERADTALVAMDRLPVRIDDQVSLQRVKSFDALCAR